MAYALAIDIGASSGRHILGHIENGEIVTKEIYRFDNGIENRNGTLCWNTENLVKEIIAGLKKCKIEGIIPDTVAIDTWGVDYMLLDEDGVEILPAVSYRDERTFSIPEQVDELITQSELYRKTGVQRVNYNTIYQLCCDRDSGKLERAAHLLMMPEYLSYKLTGVMKSEYTISSTTGLLDAAERNWDIALIHKLSLKPSIFGKIQKPGSVVGPLAPEVREEVGFDTTVVFAPSHDTASAVAACDIKGHGMYISSGTWSLVGAENKYPVLTDAAMQANFTNEGGVNDTYRFLKNIMGMWLFQNIRRNLDRKYSYDEMMNMAMESDFTETFDPNDRRVNAPENMIEAIRECLGRPDLPLCDVISSVYHSLAASYGRTSAEIESITGEKIDSITIVGGGSKDTYLNSLTEKYTKKPVIKGPVEATAIGNLKTQLNRA